MYACIEKAFEHSLLVYDEMFGSLGAIFKEELAFKLQNFWPAKGSSPNELSKFTLVARYQQKTRALSNYFRRQTATTHSVLQQEIKGYYCVVLTIIVLQLHGHHFLKFPLFCNKNKISLTKMSNLVAASGLNLQPSFLLIQYD